MRNVNHKVKWVLQGVTGTQKVRAFKCLIGQCLAMVVCFGALSASNAYALSVGDIEVNSAVGEHFYAVVKLSDTRRIQADQVLVSIAPRSIYQRMGVDWEYFHTGLIFDVLTDEHDGMYLRIVSKDLLFEPFIDFVISVRWPSGFISTQLTALLDMPRTPSSALANNDAGAFAPSNTAALKSGSVDRSSKSSQPLGSATNNVAAASSALKPASTPPSSGTPPLIVPSAGLSVSPQQALEQARTAAEASAKALVRAEKDVLAQAKSNAQAKSVARAEAQAKAVARPEARVEEQIKAEAITRSGQPPPVDSAVADLSWQFVTQAGDNLWAIARNVQRESGGRLVDIVQALHANNAAAFIGNDANKLKIDARLNLSLAQIKSATPVERRAELGRAIKNSAQETKAAPAASQSRPLVTPPSRDGGGVLSLVTNSDQTAEVSPLTQRLSREVKASSAQVDEELAASSEKVELVEERMDNLLNQYEALTEKTSQLKELEATLNRKIAEKAQIDLGLNTAAIPVPAAPPKNAGSLRNQEKDLWWWLQVVLSAAVMIGLVYGIFYALKARHVKNRNAYVQHWGEDALAPPGHATGNELAEIVKLKRASSTIAPLDDLVNQEMQVDDSEGLAELQASLYIAYQRYEEAEELLIQTLETQPDNRVLKNQLLEVYGATNKTAAYDRLLEHLAECDAQAEERKSHQYTP